MEHNPSWEANRVSVHADIRNVFPRKMFCATNQFQVGKDKDVVTATKACSKFVLYFHSWLTSLLDWARWAASTLGRSSITGRAAGTFYRYRDQF